VAARLTAARLSAALMAALLVGTCAPTSGTLPTPPASIGPTGSVGPAVARTREELVRALGTRNLVLRDTQAPFRPPEDARFTTAPRALFQVVLPTAPQEGYIVVYEFASPAAAGEAAATQAAYLASGPARVQSPLGARHILRMVGPTVVMYSWVPAGAEDPLQPDIQAALETLGTGVPVPS
jgi:hypothetical protein